MSYEQLCNTPLPELFKITEGANIINAQREREMKKAKRG